MTTFNRHRAAGILTLGMLLFFLLSWMIYVQIGSAETTNPRADFWRVVRQGVPAYTSTPAQGHTVLIQNAGENWREIRNGLLMRLSQWVPRPGTRGHCASAPDRRRGQAGETPLRREGRALDLRRAVPALVHGRRLHRHGPDQRPEPPSGADRADPDLRTSGRRRIPGGVEGAAQLLGPLLLVGIFLEFVVWVRDNIPSKFDLAWFKEHGRPARRRAAAPCGDDQRQVKRHGSGSYSSSGSAWASPARCSISRSGARPASPCSSPT